MGALLVLAVTVLAFLCGRLQVTVNRFKSAHDELAGRMAVLEHDLDVLGSNVSASTLSD